MVPNPHPDTPPQGNHSPMRERRYHSTQLLQKSRCWGRRAWGTAFLSCLTAGETEAHRGNSAKWLNAWPLPHPLLVQGRAILGRKEGWHGFRLIAPKWPTNQNDRPTCLKCTFITLIHFQFDGMISSHFWECLQSSCHFKAFKKQRWNHP